MSVPPTVGDGPTASYRLPYGRDVDPLTHAWLGEAEELMRELERLAGTAAAVGDLVDADETPNGWLAWVAQLAGVRVDDLDSFAERRRVIGEAPQRLRGTLADLRAAARLHLDGPRFARIEERTTLNGNPDADHVRVTTFAPQTPDPQRVERALMRAKAAGLVLHYRVLDGATYGDLTATWGSYAELGDVADRALKYRHVTGDHVDYAALAGAVVDYAALAGEVLTWPTGAHPTYRMMSETLPPEAEE